MSGRTVAGRVALVLAALLLLGGCEEQPSPYPSRRPDPPPLPAGVQERTYRAEELGENRHYLLYRPAATPDREATDLVVVLPGIGANPRRTLEVLPQLVDEARRLDFVLLMPDTTGYIGSSRLVREGGLNELHAAYVYGLVDAVTGMLAEDETTAIRRRFLVGTSAGGAGAWYLVTRRPEIWDGLGLVAGAGLPFEEHLDDLRHLRVAFLQGAQDTAVDIDWNRRAAGTLEQAGIPVQFVEVAGAGHEVARTTGLPELFAFLLDDGG